MSDEHRRSDQPGLEKQAKDALRDAHWRLASIIEGTHAGTWEWNVQTGETVFNEVWAQIIGYTLKELAPISIKTWGTFAHPDDLKQSGELLERHFAGELPYYDYECRMKHKDGHWAWVAEGVGKLILIHDIFLHQAIHFLDLFDGCQSFPLDIFNKPLEARVAVGESPGNLP